MGIFPLHLEIGNGLNGNIPPSFGNMSFLESLNLSDNRLSGSILEKLTVGCISLYHLKLLKNTLQGSLSDVFNGDSSLFMLDLSHNNLIGKIPMRIANNSRLREIPFEIGDLDTIQMLNLSHNSLTGSIPQTFSNLRQIESLDLSYNNLEGEIPSQITRLYSLEVFSVAHNNLSGKTPIRVAQFGTFDEGSYEGNPFLCGLPPPKACNAVIPSSRIPINSIVDNSGFIDMDIFYVSFVVSYIIVLLGIIAVLYINPYWRQAPIIGRQAWVLLM
ncbi:receptor-like protein 13 [Jatropha curcas]|uniref:receptor-like protein 13 n=1 Tax=Jatropha curcas TaxID=180498 RepID=UPI001893C8DE|nr:receptor-like protein 13 [Jatropha curcas]